MNCVWWWTFLCIVMVIVSSFIVFLQSISFSYSSCSMDAPFELSYDYPIHSVCYCGYFVELNVHFLYFLDFFLYDWCNCFDIQLCVQFNSQNSSVSPQAGLGLGVQTPGLNNVTSATLQQQPNNIHQQSNQQALMSGGPKDAGTFHFLVLLLYFFSSFLLFGFLFFIVVVVVVNQLHS